MVFKDCVLMFHVLKDRRTHRGGKDTKWVENTNNTFCRQQLQIISEQRGTLLIKGSIKTQNTVRHCTGKVRSLRRFSTVTKYVSSCKSVF